MGGAKKLTITFKGKDQGWGDQKGQVAISVDKKDPDSEFKTPEHWWELDYKGMKAVWHSDNMEHEWVRYKKKFRSDSDLIEAMDDEDED